MVKQSTAVLLYKNWTLVWRTGCDDNDGVPELNWTVPDNWSWLLFSDESRFNRAYYDGRIRVWRTTWEKYIPECLCMVNRNRIVSVVVWGHWPPRCWQSGHSRWKRECGKWCQNIVRKPSRFWRKHIQHDNAPAHTARQTVARLEQQDISIIQWSSQSADLNIIEQVWDFMDRDR